MSLASSFDPMWIYAASELEGLRLPKLVGLMPRVQQWAWSLRTFVESRQHSNRIVLVRKPCPQRFAAVVLLEFGLKFHM